MMTATKQALEWYELFSRYAEDLYPGRYTLDACIDMAERAREVKMLACTKSSLLIAHNYLYPELQEIADFTGDSLALSKMAQNRRTPRIDFGGVFFMASTAKIISGNKSRVFAQDFPNTLGCSLVSGTSYEWIKNWKRLNHKGILVTYINSDAYVKSISDFVSTSRNTDKIIAYAAQKFPGRKILVLPDKFLGFVMKARALEILKQKKFFIDPDLIEVYTYDYNDHSASCYVHEQIGYMALERALEERSEAELMIHPECGCASSCLYKINAGQIPHQKAYFLSTDQMITHSRQSLSRTFIVATEKGMVYKLRRMVPEKEFLPVSVQAECRYMKANTLEKLRVSLTENKVEIVICPDCCNPEHPYQDEVSVHIPHSTAQGAMRGITRMLEIQ